MTSSVAVPDPSATAALGICESLLLALIDLNVMSKRDVHDLLTDVAAAHIEAARLSETPLHDLAVADIIKRMRRGKDENAS